jgi:hypothetical protein
LGISQLQQIFELHPAGIHAATQEEDAPARHATGEILPILDITTDGMRMVRSSESRKFCGQSLH